MKAALVIPYRSDGGRREEMWRIAEPYQYALGIPVTVQDSSGDWNISRAFNEGMAAADDWDVVILNGADTILFPEHVAEAIEVASKIGACTPYDSRMKLSVKGTQRFADGGPEALEYPRDLDAKDRSNPRGGGGVMAVSRAAWEAIGGMDEHFHGWGFEDIAMRYALQAFYMNGADIPRTDGIAIHLWHPLGKSSPKTTARWRRLRKVRKDPEKLRAALAEE